MSNPYELRFKVLEMARDLEMQKYEQLYHPFWQLHEQVENIIAEIKDTMQYNVQSMQIDQLTALCDKLLSSLPDAPTSDQIKNKASELYEFVERKPFKA